MSSLRMPTLISKIKMINSVLSTTGQNKTKGLYIEPRVPFPTGNHVKVNKQSQQRLGHKKF